MEDEKDSILSISVSEYQEIEHLIRNYVLKTLYCCRHKKLNNPSGCGSCEKSRDEIMGWFDKMDKKAIEGLKWMSQ